MVTKLKERLDQLMADGLFPPSLREQEDAARAEYERLTERMSRPIKQVAVKKAPERPKLEKPTESNIALEEGVTEEYLKLAEKVGLVHNPVIQKQRLLNFLRNNGYGVYDYDRVETYMNGLVDRINELRRSQGNLAYGVWIWKPLRKQDVEQELRQSVNHAVLQSSFLQTAMGIPSWTMTSAPTELYDKAIPLPVMETIADISEKLPESKFFVTDYVDVKPDPFLGVKLPGMTQVVVIERWDEPSFR